MMEAGWLPDRVHPLATGFPMMPDDELEALADDIRENGLLSPIVIDSDGVLIDGRNRLAACQRAGVTPTFQQLNGHDAAAHIVSANLARRNLNKGQQAIALAMIYPEPGKAGRGRRGAAKEASVRGGFSEERVRLARTILRHSPALAEEVRDGLKPFDAALKEVTTATQSSRSTEYLLAELRRHVPDVAALVADERITLAAGRAELEARQSVVSRTIEAARHAVGEVLLLPLHLTIIGTAMALTDADLALIDADRKEIDPLAAADAQRRKQVEEAATRFAKLKFVPPNPEA